MCSPGAWLTRSISNDPEVPGMNTYADQWSLASNKLLDSRRNWISAHVGVKVVSPLFPNIIYPRLYKVWKFSAHSLTCTPCFGVLTLGWLELAAPTRHTDFAPRYEELPDARSTSPGCVTLASASVPTRGGEGANELTLPSAHCRMGVLTRLFD